MIEQYTGKKKDKERLFGFVSEGVDSDFYLTENNQRIFQFDRPSFNKLMRSSIATYYLQDRGDVVGIGIVWKSKSGEVSRYYVKIKSKDSNVAKDILTVILWNSPVKTLHAKLNKDSRYFKIFTYKGFKWFHGRGKEILLSRTELRDKNIRISKEES